MSKININTTINCPLSKVFEYYTEPIHIVNWNFANSSWHCPSATNDLKIGGKYFSRMEAKDGSMGFDFIATYTNVELFNKLTYVLLDNRVVDISFIDNKDNTTTLEISFDAENSNPEEFQKAGWQAILDNFKSYTENN